MLKSHAMVMNGHFTSLERVPGNTVYDILLKGTKLESKFKATKF
jgi:hypothetical protein